MKEEKEEKEKEEKEEKEKVDELLRRCWFTPGTKQDGEGDGGINERLGLLETLITVSRTVHARALDRGKCVKSCDSVSFSQVHTYYPPKVYKCIQL